MSQEIYVTKADKEKLLEIIDKAVKKEFRTNDNLKTLKTEINKARVIDQEVCPHAFIKMNSKVIITVDQNEEELTLVYPEEADIRSNKISVFSHRNCSLGLLCRKQYRMECSQRDYTYTDSQHH
jgi:regulator of nucleoside diphosphate kinase